MPTQRLVAGIQPVREVLRARPHEVERVMLDRVPRLDGLFRFAESQGVAAERVPRQDLDRVANHAMHQGAVAFAAPLSLLDLSDAVGDRRVVLVLDGVQDPQNFGATIRSAVGIAGAPVIWPENASAPLTPATFRASAGAIEHARLCRVASLVQALQWLTAQGFQVVALDSHADQELSEAPLDDKVAVVIGGEGRGLSRAVRKNCSGLARLVAPRTIDSLNASVAAALALYEVRRRLQLEP